LGASFMIVSARPKPTAAPSAVEACRIGGRLTSDPNRSSLGLLPSGPDPVGEWLVHRQPPGPYIGRTKRESKPGVGRPDGLRSPCGHHIGLGHKPFTIPTPSQCLNPGS